MNAERITFNSLREIDLPLMLKWLNTPHVSQWYRSVEQTFPTLEDVSKKYLPRINGKDPCACYIISYDDRPIGHLQSYHYDDYPAARDVLGGYKNCAGVDIFIGEADCIHRGLGSFILRKFLRDIVFMKYDVAGCLIDPEPQNRAAIRAYEKVGFKYLKTVWNQEDGVEAYVMSLNRGEFLARE